MKVLKRILLTVVLFILFVPFIAKAQEKEVRLYLFHQDGCPHCADEIEFLESIEDKYPTLEIVKYEISNNEMNYNFFVKVIQKTKIPHRGGVPFTLIGTDYYEGFNETTEDSLRKSIDKFMKTDTVDVISMVKNDEDLSNIKYNVDPSVEVKLPFLGDIDAKNVSLPLVSIVLGTVDGFNPCAMWVLLFLITMLFNMKDKKKMWILGITFLVTSAVVYLLFMLAWLKVALTFTSITWIRILIALVALIGGAINLRSFIKSVKTKTDGCEVVDDKKRKKIFKRIRNITSEKKFILAILGIITLAVSVNLVELACSAGLPLIFTQVLAMNDLTNLQYSIYMLLYILFFLIDDLVIFILAMVTLNVNGISSKYGKYSHLIGGIVMILIAILMVFKPEWLMFNFR